MAHALRAVAQFDGKSITGMAYYSDFTPAVKVYVQVTDQSSAFITEGLTDESGAIALIIPQEYISENTEYTVVVEGEEGHRVEVIAPQSSSPTSQAKMPSHLSSNDVMLLRKEIQQLKEKLYFHDVVSGVGYIVGVFGLVAFIASRRQRK